LLVAVAAFASFPRQFFGYRVECPAYILEHRRKFHGSHRLLRINNNIDGTRGQRRTPQPDSFAQAALDPVALDGAAEHTSHSESYASQVRVKNAFRQRTRRRSGLRLTQVEHGDVRGEVAFSLFIDALEVGVLEQPRGAWKVRSRWGRGLLHTPVGSVGAHQLTILHNFVTTVDNNDS